jgi:hypothetical protein
MLSHQESSSMRPISGGTVIISIFGGVLIPGLPKEMTLTIAEPTTLHALVTQLEQACALSDLHPRIAQHYIVLLDGKTIRTAEEWNITVMPGSTISLVAPIGGGVA